LGSGSALHTGMANAWGVASRVALGRNGVGEDDLENTSSLGRFI
jgi:hypothetical protein